jgi:hypothetical protein
MKTRQRKSRVKVMVEGRGSGSSLFVTAGARLVFELPAVRVSVRVTAGAGPFAIFEFRTPLVTASTAESRVLAVKSKTELRVVYPCASEGDGRDVARSAVCQRFGDGVVRHVTTGARLRQRVAGLATPLVTSRTTGARVLAGERKTELVVVDASVRETPGLSVTARTVLGGLCNRVRGLVTVRTPAWSAAARHSSAFVTPHAGKLRVLTLEQYPRVLMMLRTEALKCHSSERLT